MECFRTLIRVGGWVAKPSLADPGPVATSFVSTGPVPDPWEHFGADSVADPWQHFRAGSARDPSKRFSESARDRGPVEAFRGNVATGPRSDPGKGRNVATGLGDDRPVVTFTYPWQHFPPGPGMLPRVHDTVARLHDTEYSENIATGPGIGHKCCYVSWW